MLYEAELIDRRGKKTLEENYTYADITTQAGRGGRNWDDGWWTSLNME